jgi:protein gp37
MAIHTNIEWCDSSVNPTSGCDGCELYNPNSPDDATCYAKEIHENRLAKSFPAKYGSRFNMVREIPGRIDQARLWPDLRGCARLDKPWLNDMPRMIFVGDMGDFLSRSISDEFVVNEILGRIKFSPHFWLLLTKRPARLAWLSEKYGPLPDNCMAMTSLTSQRSMPRLKDLLRINCQYRGLSCEPLLGPIEFKHEDLKYLDWVITGGESGKKARPMNPRWAESIRQQCASRTDMCRPWPLPFFFKQQGEWAEGYRHGVPSMCWTKAGKKYNARQPDGWLGSTTVYRVGYATAGHKLAGEYVREMPMLAHPQWARGAA